VTWARAIAVVGFCLTLTASGLLFQQLYGLEDYEITPGNCSSWNWPSPSILKGSCAFTVKVGEKNGIKTIVLFVIPILATTCALASSFKRRVFWRRLAWLTSGLNTAYVTLLLFYPIGIYLLPGALISGIATIADSAGSYRGMGRFFGQTLPYDR
jgi:hypothetical protein